MSPKELIKPTPWDISVFNLPTWEILEYSEHALKQSKNLKGHHTIKVHPLADKRLLHEYDFYYCDSLIEPYCYKNRLREFHHSDVHISKLAKIESLLPICHEAFEYGRFHRDFNLQKAHADIRYDKWLEQLVYSNNVFELLWKTHLAGFVAFTDNRIVLHAVTKEFRGKGFSKHWLSQVSISLFSNGYQEITSSISSTNLAALNLYASLGFSFKNPLDVYHCINGEHN
jgi:ribosomal protein S18 acetylase RimI-like enzyme